MYYQSGSVLPARQYILIYILVTFGDDIADIQPNIDNMGPNQRQINQAVNSGDYWIQMKEKKETEVIERSKYLTKRSMTYVNKIEIDLGALLRILYNTGIYRIVFRIK